MKTWFASISNLHKLRGIPKVVSSMSKTPNTRRTGFAIYYSHPKLQNKYAFIVTLIVFISINVTFVSFLVTLLLKLQKNGGTLTAGEPMNELVSSLILQGGVIYLVCCSLGFFITIILTHRVVGPLARMKNVVEGLTAGVAQEDIKLRDADEMTDLADSINLLSKKLNSK